VFVGLVEILWHKLRLGSVVFVAPSVYGGADMERVKLF